MSELTRVCRVCKCEKPLSLLIPAATYKHGHKPLCWKCKAGIDKEYKARVLAKKHNALDYKRSDKINPTQAKSCGLGGWTGPREREPNEALPPQINKMKGKYTPPVWSVRSGGSDHLEIRSRGL